MNSTFLEQVIILSQKTVLSKLVEMYGQEDDEININSLENKFLKRPNILFSNKSKLTESPKKKRGRPRKIQEPVKKVLKIVSN
jgi:hypothetical protein